MIDGTLRDDIRNDLRNLFIGERTLGDSLLPPLLFVAVDAVTSLGWAAAAAVAMGAGVAAWRIVKGQKAIYAGGGIAAVVFAAWLALRSGRAESYFLPGIVSAAGWALAAVISVVVRRPLAAWSSWFIRRWPRAWYWRDDVRPAYSAVTMIWAAYFAGRAAAQWLFFAREQPEIIAAVKVGTSWPLVIPLLVVSYVLGNRRLHTLGGPNVEEFALGREPPFRGGQRGF